MPPSPTKTLSPAELAKLEHAFATDPASEAYKPLAEAYLAMGRYMEAMVVCKKGVKAHPTTPDARTLLARVYAEQGKDKKALEEVTGALQVAPSDKLALRLVALLQLRGGEGETGKANLLKAFEADPADPETLTLMQQYKVEPPKKAPPPPPPQPEPSIVVQQQAPHGNGSNGAQTHAPPVLGPQGSQPQQQAQPRVSGGQPQQRMQSQAGRPAVQQRGQAQQRAPQRRQTSEEEISSELTDLSGKKKRATSGASRALFFLLIFSVPVAAAAYYGIGQYNAKKKREVKRLLTEAGDAFKNDTFASYKLACTHAEAALDKDPESTLAHGYLAYAYTVRYGEHERDDTIRSRAEEHLADARKGKPEERPVQFFAADALFKFYTGKAAEAQKDLSEMVRKLEAEGKRPATLQLTLGIIDLAQGDLEGAREVLEKAQANASDDPRVYVALGNLFRRRGNDGMALNAYNNALKYTRNSHPEALAGTALLVLDQPDPGAGYVNAAKYLKTLLDSDPPPSSRQLAKAHFIRALLVSRVRADFDKYPKEFQGKLKEGTGVDADEAKAKSEITMEEEAGNALSRNDPELMMVRGKRLGFEGNLDGAAAEINKAIAIVPGAANYHVELAKVLMQRQGNEKAAEEAIRKALNLVPGSPKLMTLLGQLLYREKKIDECREVLEKAVTDKAKNPDAFALLGKLYRDDKKDLEKSVTNYEKAATQYFADPAMASATYDELAQTYDLKKDKDKARVNFEKALNAEQDNQDAYCHYAKFLEKLADAKDKDLTKKLASKYLKLDPKGGCADDMKRLGGTVEAPP
jgi:tetratricopeptide (TPR) repeat protein